LTAPSLSIVIPAYREEKRLPPTLAKIAEYLSAHPGLALEVVVVDDGSPDRTAAVAEEAGRDLGLSLRVVRFPENRGKGAAARAGALAAEGTLVLVSDADLSTPIAEWEKLRNAGSDVAIGSRAGDESLVKVAQSPYRRLAGKIFNQLVRLVALPGISDTQCGFKLFTRAAAQEVFARTTIDRFAWDVEALLLARRLGFSIAEVPVLWFNEEDSRVSLGGGVQAYLDVLRIRGRVSRTLRAGPISR